MDSPNLSKNHGWIVALSGLGINLALGVLYTWSMFKESISKEFGWQGSQLNDPYALCCLVFAFAMILAGRCQDKFGPRVTATIGGLLVGAGMVLISTSNSYSVWLLGFGVLVGMGIGFGYSSATPPAL
ncbi:MAG: MFS transporter, partial [Spartobacteria bacterium]|nr:MFS transporter [Spartobacteria bacterium]